ncbi:MAG: fasciclin domain-containing protein [Erythrobacter sp.]|jgi:uncharacterized surface protein with fasciclin (FAS1) repeats|nr:fasciclin domain-containing protein [Erythrobacter sp.]
MKFIKLTLASAVALSLAACAQEADEDVTTAEVNPDDAASIADAETGTIVDVASADDNFSTLVTAVTAAGLGTVLADEGPYTVFAPTNDAFAKLPEGTVETLTTEETDTLGNILQYHVVEGSVDAATLTAAIEQAGADGYTVNTLGGGTLTAMVENGSVVLMDAAGNKATVTATDVEASNGVIHVIDTVLMPE